MTLREALQAVYDRNGRLTAEIVVEEARGGTDAVAQFLYDRLTWDDEEAAERWRLEEAAKLIRRVRITYAPSPRSKERETRFWVNTVTPEGRGFMPITEVAADPLLSRLVLAEAERAWRDLKARYGHLAEFIAMIQAELNGGDSEAA